MPILTLALKDLVQMLRDRKTFMFLLFMPIGFTLLFGYAFSGVSSGETSASEDPRLPVGFDDQDGSLLSGALQDMLAASLVIRLQTDGTLSEMEQSLAEGDLAGVVIVPAGYHLSLLSNQPLKLIWLTDTESEDTAQSQAGQTAQSAVLTAASRLASAARAAVVVNQVMTPGEGAPTEAALQSALAAWQNPPVRLDLVMASAVPLPESQGANFMGSMTHSAPGMMLQFAIAGLLTCAQVLVNERKNRCMARLLTTATSRWQILLGHYLAIFLLILVQFATLIVFGQLVLKLDYARQPAATGLMVVASALCISALGLLIGALARSDEQAIIFSLIPMFVFSGLGGAWVPLELTGETFQAIGHLTPVAWAMDGFKGILLRGLDPAGVLLPAGALIGYAVLFFTLAVWRFKFE